ncbi:hypothetical protein [Lacicoccus qingdaonensis]|uniref:Uncharacterized protein n=1 Tax=Lacicoccus qingdaonensis TaxID=576118 RepID=A0A1G9F2S3_9BACL|nr:hypothetical protein [Salinicoccus qingdaonensis]SDK82638.1 hypothetical protein SAMN05216216_11094 [Salinicoccus qingdaonensis]
MAIELKLKKDDEYKTHKRPNTNVLELEEFEEFQDELGKIYEEYVKEVTAYESELQAYQEAVTYKKDGEDVDVPEPKAISFYPYKKRMRDRQIEYIVEIFEAHDPFTVKEFKLGIDSEKLDDTIVGIFKQISPNDFKDDDEGKQKNSRSKRSKRT